MAAIDTVRVERFGIADVAQFLVRIFQIAGRDQDALAIHGGVVIMDFRFLLFLLLYGGLARRQTEQGAQDRSDSRDAPHQPTFSLPACATCGESEASLPWRTTPCCGAPCVDPSPAGLSLPPGG